MRFTTGADLDEQDGRELRTRVLGLIWKGYSPRREWPARKDFRILLRNLEIDFERVRRMSGVDVDDVVKATFDGLLVVPEVRNLFGPLPALLRLASKRFREAPDYLDGKDPPEVTLSDLRQLWPDEGGAKLASDVIWDTRFSLLSPSNLKTAPKFRPALECLRFADVRTVDEYEGVLNEPHGLRVDSPSGTHLELLHFIHEHVKRYGRWPNPMLVAVEQKDHLGYVPWLVEQLQPEFIKGSFFPRHRHEQLELTLRSLEMLDPEALKLVPVIVRAIAALWEETPSNGTGSISLSAIAQRTRLSVDALRGVVRYLESESWHGGGSYPTWAQPEYEWRVLPREEIDDFRDVVSWDDYCRRRTRHMGFLDSPGQPHASRRVAIRVAPERKRESTEEASARAPEVPQSALMPPRVFISHASRDVSTVTHLLRLVTDATGIRQQEIRCTSVPGYKLPIGTDVATALPAEIVGADVFVCLITADALQSAYVLFEAGARWGTLKKVLPVLGPGASPEMLPAPIASRHAAHTSSRADMHQFVRELAEELGVELAPAEAYEGALSALIEHAPASLAL